MKSKSKSNKKMTPIKTAHHSSIKMEESCMNTRWRDTSTRSNRSLYSKGSVSLSPSKQHQMKHNKENRNSISKEYTKQTYRRFQQKLNIFQKIQELIRQIKDRQSKLKSYFEIYRMLESQIGQQRCLEHNNDLSLYCQTECKVLCVHCVYGQSKHKTHKVVPLKDCMKDVNKDISRLQQAIKNDIQGIKIKVRTCESNQKFIERHFKQQILDLQKSYNEKLHELQLDFCEKKKHLNTYFQGLIKQNSELISSLKQFEKNIHLKLSVINKEQNVSHSVFDMKQVSKQTILSKISQLSDVKGILLDDLDSKDIGKNCLRSRIKVNKK